mmetsp:Transcript_28805/g.48590  ORF Transcript_28805/g.48590 Transcript_28805/m.48590 type:complete len:383 (-) Transcript_28805:739-1887(-)
MHAPSSGLETPVIKELSEDKQFVSKRLPMPSPVLDPCTVKRNIILNTHGQAYGIVEPHPSTDDQMFGKVFLGSVLQQNKETGEWEQGNRSRPDIRIQIINFRKYIAQKEVNPLKGEDVMNMIAVLQYLKPFEHPNIANIIDCLQDNKFMYIVTEYGGPDLFDTITSVNYDELLNEEKSKNVFIQIVTALSFLQEVGIYHRDLTVETVLFNPTTGAVKITGFGAALRVPRMTLNQIEQEFALRQIQALNPYPLLYQTADTESGNLIVPLLIINDGLAARRTSIPPEAFNRKPLNGFLADMWSLGVLLFYILTGGPPWHIALTSDKYFNEFVEEKKLMSALDGTALSAGAKHLIDRMLRSVTPADRLTLDELRAHPWLNLPLSC